MCWIATTYLYGLTTIVWAQIVYAYYATQDMGSFYTQPLNIAYEVFSLVPAVALGVLAVCVRSTHMAGQPLDVYQKYRSAAGIATLVYMVILALSVLSWVLYCLPYPIH